MGPTERQAAAAIARSVWPFNPVSRRVARALVRAARVLDDDPHALYPYAGRVRDVFDALLELLAELPQTAGPLHALRAERSCRAVERGETITNAECISALEPNEGKAPHE